jgi:hypothetical protein
MTSTPALRQDAGFLLGGYDALVLQGVEAAAFTFHDALETNFVPQDIVRPLQRLVQRRILDFRVNPPSRPSPRPW